MTPPGSDPPHAPGPTRSGYSGSAWPAGFRGIGGHLIRPPAPTSPPEAPDAPTFGTHGAHLLSPIVSNASDGSRAAACPVCLTSAALPATGGWVPVRCYSCGTEFVATDGSPPPAPLPHPRSPLAPSEPSDPRPPDADTPRGFTSDVRTMPDGRKRVTCPQCRMSDVEVPRGATVAVVLRCPVCRGPFLVNLDGAHAPPAPPPPTPPAPGAGAPGVGEAPVARVYGTGSEAVAPCPTCGTPFPVPLAARGWVWFACARCATVFKANPALPALPRSALPPPASASPSSPSSPAAPAAPMDPTPDPDVDGRYWDYCPRCRLGAMQTYLDGAELVQTCSVCGKRVVIGRSKPPPPPPDAGGRVRNSCPRCGRVAVRVSEVAGALVPTCSVCGDRIPTEPEEPARLSLWQRIRRWFGG